MNGKSQKQIDYAERVRAAKIAQLNEYIENRIGVLSKCTAAGDWSYEGDRITRDAEIPGAKMFIEVLECCNDAGAILDLCNLCGDVYYVTIPLYCLKTSPVEGEDEEISETRSIIARGRLDRLADGKFHIFAKYFNAAEVAR